MVTLIKDVKAEEKSRKGGNYYRPGCDKRKNYFHAFPAAEVCEFQTEEIGGRHEINSTKQTSIQ